MAFRVTFSFVHWDFLGPREMLEIERRQVTREPLERSIMCDLQSLDQDLVAVLCSS